MIRGVIVPGQLVKYTPTDFAKDAMACIDRMDADFDEITCSPVVHINETPPLYEGPQWNLLKNHVLLDGTNEEWKFSFTMPFEMMRRVLSADNTLMSIIGAAVHGGPLPIGDWEDNLNVIYDKKARHKMADKILDEKGRFASSG